MKSQKQSYTAEDALFARLVKMRDNNMCRVCFVGGPSESMECSHFWGRRYEGTRFDFDNADTMCHSCHSKFEDRKGPGRDYWIWKYQQLGEDRFDALRIKAHGYNKRDRWAISVILKAALIDMERSQPIVWGAKQ